jgi:hypothetical protein
MRFACWITKATDTHAEYVIRIVFPRKKWLRESIPVLSDTHIACLVKFKAGRTLCWTIKRVSVARLEVLTALLLKIQVFRRVTLCHWVTLFRCLYFQGSRCPRRFIKVPSKRRKPLTEGQSFIPQKTRILRISILRDIREWHGGVTEDSRLLASNALSFEYYQAFRIIVVY